jgi:hypothetical protein
MLPLDKGFRVLYICQAMPLILISGVRAIAIVFIVEAVQKGTASFF